VKEKNWGGQTGKKGVKKATKGERVQQPGSRTDGKKKVTCREKERGPRERHEDTKGRIRVEKKKGVNAENARRAD